MGGFSRRPAGFTHGSRGRGLNHYTTLGTVIHSPLSSNGRISSEDSGEVPSYTEDSDDSYSLDLDTDSSRTGQMNLLEEILDSLSATTTEQGKLSAAKSLDFFRSMDDIDYTATVGKRTKERWREGGRDLREKCST